MPNQSEWFLKKFREWETKTGRRQSEAAWARWLGVKPPTLNRWVNGDATPEGEHLRLLSAKLGEDIYDALGVQPPKDDPFAQVPGKFGVRLRAAFAEYQAELYKRGLDPNSDAAADLFSECLKHQGWL